MLIAISSLNVKKYRNVLSSLFSKKNSPEKISQKGILSSQNKKRWLAYFCCFILIPVAIAMLSVGSSSAAVIVTVDGLNFVNTLDFLVGPDLDLYAPKHYLRTAIESMQLDFNMVHVYSFDWNLDAQDTKYWVNDETKGLKAFLREKYNEARNNDEEFIVVAHSWGTVLSWIALADETTKQIDPIICDHYITLGSPLGTGFAHQGLYLDELVVVGYVGDHLLNNGCTPFNPCLPDVNAHTNFWAWGDIISGPIETLYYTENIRLHRPEAEESGFYTRNIFSTPIWHKYDSLQSGGTIDNQFLIDDIEKLIVETLSNTMLPRIINHRVDNLEPTTNLYVVFNKEMNASTFDPTTIFVNGSDSGIHSCSYSYDSNTHELTISPSVPFEYGETVSIQILPWVEDVVGNNMEFDYNFGFTVMEDNTPDIRMTIYEPDGVDDATYDFYIIKYFYTDNNKDGDINFYYDTDPNKGDQTPEADFLGVVGSTIYYRTEGAYRTTTYVWDARSIPKKSYYIYARMSNGDETITTRSLGMVDIIEIPVQNNFSISDVQVTEDPGDGDGVPESGESLELKVEFTNTGDVELWDIVGTITAAAPTTIEIEDGEISFGTLASGATKQFSDYEDDFDIKVLPTDYEGPLNLVVRFQYREFGGSLIQEYDMLVGGYLHPDGAVQPRFEILNISVEEDDDSDGIIESGEDVKFKVVLRNYGNATAINVDGEFDPISQASLTDSESYPDLDPGENGESYNSYKLYDIPNDFAGSIVVNMQVTYGEDGGFVDDETPYVINVSPTPHLYLQPREYAFGVKNPNDGPVSVPFSITNRGSSALHISDLLVSDPEGGTNATDTQIIGPLKDLEPGEEASFELQIDIASLEGEVSRTLEVVSDAHTPVENVLTVNGYVSNLPVPIPLGNGYDPDVFDNYIVWDQSGQIQIRNLLNQESMILSEPGYSFNDPRIHEYNDNHIVVFEESNSDDIWMYTIETGDLRPVCQAAGEQRDPQIWDRFIVWRDDRNNSEFDIYGYDLLNNTELAVETGNENNDFAIYDGTVVVYKEVSGTTTTHYLVTKVLPDGSRTAKQLTSYPIIPRNLSFYGGRVVFDGSACQYCSDDQLWVFNVSDNSIEQLTTFEDDHVNADIWGCSVVYEDRRGIRSIYTVDACNPSGEDPLAVSDSSTNDPAIWEHLVAFESGGEIFVVTTSAKDLSIDFECPVSSLVGGSTVQLAANIYNVGSEDTTNIPVRFFLGNPNDSGVQIGQTQTVSVPQGGSQSVSIDWSAPLLAGDYEICAVLDLPEDLTAVMECCTITVLNPDTDSPDFSNITIEEYNGDSDGIIDSNEQVTVSWDLSDTSGICGTTLTVDGQPITVEGTYYGIAGPFDPGVVDITLTASDCSTPVNTSTISEQFNVYIEPEVVGVSTCGMADVAVDSVISIDFNVGLQPSSITSETILLEDGTGSVVECTVSYISSLKSVLITPDNLLTVNTLYSIRVVGGPSGVIDENGGWLSIVDFSCSFTTASVAYGKISVNPNPDLLNAGWTIVGPDGYSHSGTGDEVLIDLAPGQYTVDWIDTAGWSSPSPDPVSAMLPNAGTLAFVGEYKTVPWIQGILPASVSAGATITISGGNFGNDGIVLFSGSATETNVLQWSDSEIICVVPADAASGCVNVTSEGISSNCYELLIKSDNGSKFMPWIPLLLLDE